MQAAFNDMMNRQKITEYEAGFLAMMYAAHFVEERVGPRNRAQLLENVAEEMERSANGGMALPELPADHPLLSALVAEDESAQDDTGPEIAQHIHQLLQNMKLGGIPEADIPPVLAEYAGMMALALVGDMGLQTLIIRMQDMLDDYRDKRPPFDAQG